MESLCKSQICETLGHVTRSRKARLSYQLHTLLKLLLAPDQAIRRNLDKYHLEVMLIEYSLFPPTILIWNSLTAEAPNLLSFKQQLSTVTF